MLALVSVTTLLWQVVSVGCAQDHVHVYRTLQGTTTTGSSSSSSNVNIPPRPHGRFIPWSLLTEQARNAATTTPLGYTNVTWNLPTVSTAAIEGLDYGSLTATQIQAVTTAMGIGSTIPQQNQQDNEGDAEIWDCWINHYNNYDWSEMDANLQAWWQDLGWTQLSWDNGVNPPDTETLAWMELSVEQQLAAEHLCFDQTLWDGVNLELLTPPTAAPTTSLAPTFEGQTAVPTVQPTVTVRPVAAPTAVPTVTYVKPPAIAYRYDTAWHDLPANIQSMLQSELAYTANLWNVPGSHPLEQQQVWDALTVRQQTALSETLPWTPAMWNCHVNHYTGLSWSALKTTPSDDGGGGGGVQQYWQTLGWTDASWSGQVAPPDTENASWQDLTADQQEAATQLCYFAELWDGMTLEGNVGSGARDWHVQGLLGGMFRVFTVLFFCYYNF